MKIELITFTDTQQITDYWNQLGENNLQYHLDDDLDDIVWSEFPNNQLPNNLLADLKENHERLWSFCESEGVSPWDYISLELN